MELSFDVLRKTTSPKIQYLAAIHQKFQFSVCKRITLCCFILSFYTLHKLEMISNSNSYKLFFFLSLILCFYFHHSIAPGLKCKIYFCQPNLSSYIIFKHFQENTLLIMPKFELCCHR